MAEEESCLSPRPPSTKMVSYQAKVVDCTATSLILRVTGASEKLDGLITLLRPFGVIELVRSGKVLMTRGPEIT